MKQRSTESLVVQGRELSAAELVQIAAMVNSRGDWTRRRLSIELCELWNWRNAAGHTKDMSCGNLLLKLHRRGLIELPAPTRRPPQLNGRIQRSFEIDETPIDCRLFELGALSLVTVHEQVERRRLFQQLLRTYHYVGHGQRSSPRQPLASNKPLT